MREVLDEIENEKPRTSYYWGLIILHSLVVAVIFLHLMLSTYAELVYKVLDTDIHVAGILTFIVLILNSVLIANRLGRDSKDFSNYKIAFAGGLSFVIGNITYRILMKIYFYYQGVFHLNKFQFLISALMLFIFAFLITLIRVKKVRKEKNFIEKLILAVLWFSIGYLMT